MPKGQKFAIHWHQSFQSFASKAAHEGIQQPQPRKQVLESLCYRLIFFLKRLPWDKEQQQTDIKLQSTIKDICEGVPREFQYFLSYCDHLIWSATPKYNYLENLLKNCIIMNNFKDYMIFDWDNLH